MPKVEFKYDIFKDEWNMLRVLTLPPTFDKNDTARTQKGIDVSLVEQVNNTKDYYDKQFLIADFVVNKFLPANQEFIKKQVEIFQQRWSKINGTYFQRLGEILNIKISTDNLYTAFLTQAGSCPFNTRESWFMVRINDEDVNNVVCHEIMHIEFERAYGMYCRNLGLPVNLFEDTREALTTLLNEEMSDILPHPDYGYKEHQELREEIKKLWNKEKDLKYLLDKINANFQIMNYE